MTSKRDSSTFMNPSKLDIDKTIDRLMNIGKQGTGFTSTFTEDEIHDLITDAKQVFLKQPMMVELNAPVSVCGDIHGQFGDLMRIFNVCQFPPDMNYLFLGDYVDRGQFSIETIMLLLAIKIKFPDNFVLLRGNHETRVVNRIYGFYDDLNKRFGNPRLFEAFQNVFNNMPLTGLISQRILCMHGGLSNEMLTATSLDVLNKFTRPLLDPPNPSLAIDLLWADPDINTKGFKMSIRGCSCTFGPDVVTQICEKFKLDLVVRAHQVVQDGYEFFANKKLVTIFSAPHYCGQFDNAAAVLQVSEKLVCSFKIFRPSFPKPTSNADRSSITVLPAPPS